MNWYRKTGHSILDDVPVTGELKVSLWEWQGHSIHQLAANPRLTNLFMVMCPHYDPIGLARLRGLVEVRLMDGSLRNESVPFLCEAIRKNPTIQSLSIEYNRLSGSGVQAICSALMGCESLKGLFLSGNSVEGCTMEIIKLLETHDIAGFAAIDCPGLTDEVLLQLAPVIGTCARLENLRIVKREGMYQPETMISFLKTIGFPPFLDIFYLTHPVDGDVPQETIQVGYHHALKSPKPRILSVLLSIFQVRRLDKDSPLNILNKDIIRRLALYI